MAGKQFLYILALTLITILFWFGADFMHARTTKFTPPPEVTQLLEPISPNFDQEVINELGI